MAAFTSIATAASLAATAGSTAMSFAQAAKQREAMNKAQRAAEEAMESARKKLEINVFDALSIQKEPYELEREALLSQGAQAIQAGVESERGAAATAGRVQMAQQEGQAGIRTAMGQELQALEKLSAQEESRLRDVGVQLDLEEVAGAQLAAANAQELAAQATQQGFEGVTSLGQQLTQFAPMYEKGATGRQIGRLESMADRQKGLKGQELQAKVAALGTRDGVDLSKLGTVDRGTFLTEISKLKPETLRTIRQDLGLYGFNPFKTSTYNKLF